MWSSNNQQRRLRRRCTPSARNTEIDSYQLNVGGKDAAGTKRNGLAVSRTHFTDRKRRQAQAKSSSNFHFRVKLSKRRAFVRRDGATDASLQNE